MGGGIKIVLIFIILLIFIGSGIGIYYMIINSSTTTTTTTTKTTTTLPSTTTTTTPPPEYKFEDIFKPGKKSVLKSSNGKYCTDMSEYNNDPNRGMECAVDVIKEWEQYIVEKRDNGLTIKSNKNGKFCSDDRDKNKLICNRDAALEWETFKYVINPDKTITLSSGRTGKVCSATNDNITCGLSTADETSKISVSSI